jgi:HK97 family phage portal protein
MGLFSGLFGSSEPKNAIVLDENSALFRSFVASYTTASGKAVNSDSAIASVAVLACLIVRSESLMLCPVDVYKKDGRARESASNHPVSQLIADAPNPLMSSEEFWRWKQITEDLRGNAYARIEWRGGRPVALWPMFGTEPQILTGGYQNPVLVYRYNGDDFTPAGDYPASEIMHFKGPLLSTSPYKAKSLIEATAENIGLGLATEEFFARFLSNGTHFPQYLHTPEKLNDDDMAAIRKQLDKDGGLLPAGRTRVFDRGLKVETTDMSLKDADLSGHQRWILEQVCRTFRVPLPMVQDLTHGTYTNSEQADLWLSKYTATPIVRNTEGVIRRKLFLPSERATYYAKFNVNAMMRGDFAARTAGYSVLINCGVLSPNEARAFEDWNPYEGGDEFRVPLNTIGVNDDFQEQKAKFETVGLLVRSGFDPAGSLDALELPEIAYSDVQPVTVRPIDSDGLQLAPADPNAQNQLRVATSALAPLLGDAKARILQRHGQNLERGRSEADSLAFAEIVLNPIIETAHALGIEMDVRVVAQSIIDHADDESESEA